MAVAATIFRRLPGVSQEQHPGKQIIVMRLLKLLILTEY
jgi:hypothetical protein